MSEQHSAAELHSWTAISTRRWLSRCDLCHTPRLVADYFEGYLYHNRVSLWLWACSECLMDEIIDRLAAAERHES